MKLKELIEPYSDDIWIDVTLQATDKYKVYIGRAPKSMIKGPALNYEVLKVKEFIETRCITIQSVLVKKR